MPAFCPLVVRLSILLVIPLSDLAISLSTVATNYPLILSHCLSLFQSWLYAHHYYSIDKKLFLLSCCSFTIYVVSLFIQAIFYKRHVESASLVGSSALFLSSAHELPTQLQSGLSSSLINNLTNSLSNSISISPALTSLSKRSTDLLLFKIDDILSPHIHTSQQQLSARSDLLPFTATEKGPNQNSYPPSLMDYMPTSRPSLKSSRTSPIMATLLALSAPPPANAAPIATLNSTTLHNYNSSSVLNFLLATTINLVSMQSCPHFSTLHLFKSFIAGLTWLLILLIGCPFTPALPSMVVILFENRFLILVNTVITAISFIFCALNLFNSESTPEKGNESDTNNTDSIPSKHEVVVSYRTISDL